MKPKGIVYLVGAGPGDAGLLTLRGAELLGRADVVVYDALVNSELLRLAPKSAEIIYGGKRARDHGIAQDELNRLLIAKSRRRSSAMACHRLPRWPWFAGARPVISNPSKGRSPRLARSR